MSYENMVREHKQALEQLVKECSKTLEHPPNVIAQNKLVVLTAIIEKAIMICEEAIQAATLRPKEVEAILDEHTRNSAEYGVNPTLDEVNAMRNEIERLTLAVDILQAMHRRRDLAHRLVGHDPRLSKPWARWIKTLEQYKISEEISEKHRQGLLSAIDHWRIVVSTD